MRKELIILQIIERLQACADESLLDLILKLLLTESGQ
jgi:hypothetical protein